MAELAKIRGEQIKDTVMRDSHFDANNPIKEDKVDIKWDEHLQPLTDISTREDNSANGYFTAGDYTAPEERIENIEQVVDTNLQEMLDSIEQLKGDLQSQLAPFQFQVVPITEGFTGEVVLDRKARKGTVYLFVNGTVQLKELVTENVVPEDEANREHVDKVTIVDETVITEDEIQLFYTPIDPAKQGAEEPELIEKATANITVKLPDGNFATGASVTLGQETKTVADQALVFESTAGEHNLSVTLAGYQDVNEQVTLTADTPLNKEVNLVAQVYKLSGVVKDTDGQPIEGATVEAVLSV